MLFIHRNTLRYRLEKITEITGLPTTNFVGLAELYIATRLSKNGVILCICTIRVIF